MSNINDTLKRINELAAKKKSGQELTPEELAEKKELYNIYLGFIKGQITDTLDRVEFVDPKTGERTAPKKALENLALKADKEIKEQAEIIFSESGLNMTTAINMFLKTIVLLHHRFFQLIPSFGI